jgi:hypothetical protein
MSTASEALRELAAALRAGGDHVAVVASVRRIPSPQGDPALIREAANDLRRCAGALDSASLDLGTLRRERLPLVWPAGAAPAAAAHRLHATDQHSEHSGQVLDRASRVLHDLADRLEAAQVQDGTAREQIETAIMRLPVAEDYPTETDHRAAVTSMFAGHIDAVADAARQAEDAGIEAARLLNESAAQATAGQLDAPSLGAADRLLLAVAGDRLGPVLTASNAERAAAALHALTPANRRAFHGLLDAAGSDRERAWLLKALAAGNDLAALTGFGEQIRNRDPAWLEDRLRPLVPGRTHDGRNTWLGASLQQQTDTTCGSMSLLLNRALHDPVYALGLATGPGDMADRLANEETSIQHQTNHLRVEHGTVTGWPSAIGTAPGHAADWLSTNTRLDYRVSWEAFRGGEETTTEVAEDVAATTAAEPTMLLLGGGSGLNAHYVLMVGQENDHIQVYDPGVGRIEEIRPGDMHREPSTELGWSRVLARITPAGTAER